MGSLGYSEPSTSNIDPQLVSLFERIETEFKHTQLKDDQWYLLTIAALVGGNDPECAQQLYLYMINQPHHATSEARQALIRRLREALVKSVSIVGVCKPLEAIMAIAKVEKPEDRDYACTRTDWQCDQANHDRGMGWMRKVYTKDTDSTQDLFAAHRDFAWISQNITYGLYLSDRQVLDDVDTELVVLSGIMIQNLRKETHWHIRGSRRIGISKSDVQRLCGCVQMLAKYMGLKLDRVPTVDEVESDV